MRLTPTPLTGLWIADTDAFADHRGTFARLFCARELAPALGQRTIVQVNRSQTRQPGAVRGLHYQLAPHAEMKLVRCLRGRVWDVAVDLRAGSPSFLRWYAMELEPGSARMLIIPEGFAHGFQVLDADSELVYMTTAPYTPAAEGGVSPTEPRLAIEWPLPIVDLSARDAAHAPLASDFKGIEL